MRVIFRQRALAAAVSLAYLLGYLLVFQHFVAEQHALCAEHGEAHHVETADNVADPLAEGIAAVPASIDDHCHLLAAVRDQIAPPATATQTALVSAPAYWQPLRPPSLGSVLTDAVWRYAPKTSPPTHA